jgi:superfamily II DNA/RNA helicase
MHYQTFERCFTLLTGIGIDDVSLVVNFDVPVTPEGKPDYENYLHRIGRCGRFGRTGKPLFFFCTVQYRVLLYLQGIHLV